MAGASGEQEEPLEPFEGRAQRRALGRVRRELVEPDRPAGRRSDRASVTADDEASSPASPVRRSGAIVHRSGRAKKLAVEIELRRREALALDLVLPAAAASSRRACRRETASGGRSPRWTAGSTPRRTSGRTPGSPRARGRSRRDGRGDGEDERGAHRRLRAAASAKPSSSGRVDSSILPCRARRRRAPGRWPGPAARRARAGPRPESASSGGAPRNGFEEDAAVPRAEKRRRGEDLVGGEPGDETPAFRGREARESGGQPPTRPGPAAEHLAFPSRDGEPVGDLADIARRRTLPSTREGNRATRPTAPSDPSRVRHAGKAAPGAPRRAGQARRDRAIQRRGSAGAPARPRRSGSDRMSASSRRSRSPETASNALAATAAAIWRRASGAMRNPSRSA